MDEEIGTANAYTIPHWLAAILEAIISVVVTAMLLLISADVVLRYFFNSPIVGSFELIRFMMALLIFSAIPLATGKNAQISIGIMDNTFTGVLRRLQMVLISLANCAALGLISYLLFRQGASLSRLRKVTGDLQLPMAPLAYAIAALALVTLVIQIIVSVRVIFSGEKAGD